MTTGDIDITHLLVRLALRDRVFDDLARNGAVPYILFSVGGVGVEKGKRLAHHY